MRVYFFFSVHEPLYHEVAADLRDRYGTGPFAGLVFGRDQREFLLRKGFPWSRIDAFSDWLREAQDKPEADAAFLDAAEARYGAPTLSLMVFSDRHLGGCSYEEMLRILEVTIRRTEEALDAERPDAVVFESVEGLASYILHAVARYRGIPCLALDGGRIRGRTAIYRDPAQHWQDVESAFGERRRRDLTPTERSAAEEFVARFRAERPRPVALGEIKYVNAPTVETSDVGHFAKAVRRHRNDPLNVTLRGPAEMLRMRVLRLARHHWSRLRGLFETPPPGEKFVLFPLHFQPEAATLVLAPYYLDQVALIEDIAKSIPVGHRLYVKEHFASLGRRSLADYRRIKRIWNVRLVSPLADSFDLVERASAVATITGTMGWEALLLERPVVLFGHTFYEDFPFVLHAGRTSKEAWPAIFRRAVEEHAPDREVLLKFVSAVLAGTYPIRVSMQNPWTDPVVLEEDNVRNVADLLAAGMGLKGPDAAPREA